MATKRPSELGNHLDTGGKLFPPGRSSGRPGSAFRFSCLISVSGIDINGGTVRRISSEHDKVSQNDEWRFDGTKMDDVGGKGVESNILFSTTFMTSSHPGTYPATSSTNMKQASIPTKQDKTIRRSHLSPDKLVETPLGTDIRTVADSQ